MATGDATSATPGTPDFGRVSRTKGVLFRYLTLAASLVGVVALAVLLGYVVVDAFGLDEAGVGWYLVVLSTVVAPTGAVVRHWYRNPSVGRVGVRLAGISAAGIAVGLALFVLFDVINPQQWFLLYTLAVLPAAGLLLYGRRREDGRAPVAAGATFLVGALAAAAVWRLLFYYPVDWLIFVWTVGLPVAAGAWVLLRRRHGPRAGRAAAAIVVAGSYAVGVLLAFVLDFVGPEAGVLLSATAVAPTALYAASVLADRRGAWPGVVGPAVPFVGAAVGWLLVGTLGVAPPSPWLDWQFLTAAPSRFPAEAGLYPAIAGSVIVIVLVGVLSFVLGVGAAVYLEEYATHTGPLGAFTRLVQVNISNLAGVPSVVYGLLGLALFVNLVGFGFGTVLVAAMTLSLLILPIVIISAQEALRAVPDSLRQASFGMGATRWQTVREVVLPRALPGVLTGTILALGRAIGETAPLIMIGVAQTMYVEPDGLLGRTTAMPMQIFAWSDLPQEEFRYGVVAAGVVTLLVVLIAMNASAIVLRNRYQREM